MVLFVLVWCPVNFVNVDFFIADPTVEAERRTKHRMLTIYPPLTHLAAITGDSDPSEDHRSFLADDFILVKSNSKSSDQIQLASVLAYELTQPDYIPFPFSVSVVSAFRIFQLPPKNPEIIGVRCRRIYGPPGQAVPPDHFS